LELGFLMKRPAFEDREKRLELIRRINEIPGASVPTDRADLWPGIELAQLVDPGSLGKFLGAYDWVLDEYRRSARTGAPEDTSPPKAVD
jgi:hypothetical protein